MRLHAIDSGPAPGGPDQAGAAAPPLVLLHGLYGQGRNFGAVQRAVAARRRVIALDARNHGASPHAPRMDYGTLAADALETLRALDALPCLLVGHSMGGKTAMRLTLAAPEAVLRLMVVDIAPVAYPPHQHATAAALAGLALTPALTRGAADAALAAGIADAATRGFLLQNLQLGAVPGWRIGLAEIADALPDLEGWDVPPDTPPWPGPALFVRGARSDYVLPDHRPAIRALFPAARIVTVKDAGHLVHAQNPAGFMAVLDAFLA